MSGVSVWSIGVRFYILRAQGLKTLYLCTLIGVRGKDLSSAQ
uniref:Uncharacterized protein n=1 Tax=uncultured marine crenarchaeote HF4000_APKG10I20 TaxID=455612 RepID=B3TCB7_9ARCH|nr:hypothetical protein ALOHA_HF4000APKG10I20ctg7g13 [uncultured marine crenarchaeote HF4000_APKG10I20]